NQGGLSRVRKADKSGIGEQLQFQPKLKKFAWMAFLVLRWCLVRRGSEPGVASAALAPSRHGAALSRSCKVKNLLAGLGILNDRAHRNGYLNRRAVVPGSVAAFTVPAAPSLMLRI